MVYEISPQPTLDTSINVLDESTIRWRGDWIRGLSYDLNEVVYYNGSSWRALRTTSAIPSLANPVDWAPVALGGAELDSGSINLSNYYTKAQTYSKTEADAKFSTLTVGDATTTTKGILQLAGDLSGNASAPTVPALANKANLTDIYTRSEIDSRFAQFNPGSTIQSDGTFYITANVVTASIANGTTTNANFELNSEFLLSNITTNVPARIKLYRSITDRTNGTELILDVETTTDDLNFDLPDPIFLITASDTLYGTITNTSGGSASVSATLKGYKFISGTQDATTTIKGIIQLAGDLAGTAIAPTVPGLATKVDLTTDQSIAGIKSFTGSSIITKELRFDKGALVSFIQNPDTTNSVFDFTTTPTATGQSSFRFFRNTNSTGRNSVSILRGDNTLSPNVELSGNGNSYLNALAGNVGIGTQTGPLAKLQVTGGVVVTNNSGAVTDPGAGNMTVSGTVNSNLLNSNLLTVTDKDNSRNNLGVIDINYAVNPRFNYWNRGTTFTFPASTATVGTTEIASGWVYLAAPGTGNTSPNVTVSQQAFPQAQTEVPNNPLYYMQTSSDSAWTASSNGYIAIRNFIGDVYTFAGQTITISFWARSSIVGKTINAATLQMFGSGGTPSTQTFSPSQTITLTTNWARYSLTFNVPSISGKTIGTNGIQTTRFGIEFGYFNSAHPWNAAGTVDLADVALDAGTVASPVMPLPANEEKLPLGLFVEQQGPNNNVSIGTTNIANAKLQVTGGVVVSNSATAASNPGSGNIKIEGEDTFIGIDSAGNNRFGLVKKTGANQYIAYGSTASFSIAQGNNVNLSPAADTYTSRMIFNSNGTISMAAATSFNSTATFGSLAQFNSSTNVNGSATFGSQIRLATSTITANLTVASQHTIFANATTAPITITLPLASAGSGRWLIIKKIDTSANAVTITPTSPNTIDGQASVVLSTAYQYILLECDANNWYIIG